MENKKKEKKKKYVTALDATFPISPGDGVGGRIIGKRFNRCLRDSALLALRCPVSFTHLLSIPRDFVGGGYHQVHFEHPLLPPIPSNGFFDGKAFHPLFHSGPNISSDEPRTHTHVNINMAELFFFFNSIKVTFFYFQRDLNPFFFFINNIVFLIFRSQTQEKKKQRLNRYTGYIYIINIRFIAR